MSTEPKIEDGMPDVLDRAAGALRDTPIPSGPSPGVQSAMLAALSRGGSPRRVSGLWSIAGTPVLARAAAIACLAAGAAAVCFFLLQRHDHYVQEKPLPYVLPQTIDHRGPNVPEGSMVTGEIRFEGSAPPPRLIDFGATGGCPEPEPADV